jgi:long-chain acyl-CoA synthetase
MDLYQGERLRHVGDVPAMSAERYPENPAIRFEDETQTYADLEATANRVASLLSAHGIGPGDRVALYLPNTLTFPSAYFGVLKTGAVAVPLNRRRPLEGLTFVVEDADISAIVGADGLGEEVLELARETSIDEVFVPGGGEGAVDWAGVADADPTFDRPERAVDDDALMLYTSGTTGQPKGVPLTHENVLSAIESAAASGYYVPVDPESSGLIAIPFFHSAGLNSILTYYLYSGATVVVLETAEPRAMLDAIDRYDIQTLGGVPTLYTKMQEVYRESPGEFDLSSLETVAASGANLPEATRRAIVEDWEVVMTEGWGMTETSPCGTFQPHRGVRKGAGCVGPPMYGVTLKLADPRTRETLVPAAYFEPHVDIGETDIDFDDESAVTGEIAMRGPQVFEGYHDRPELTEAAFDDEGWFYTKDIARVDADGYLWLVDRADDMIVCGGENVYPAEVENALHEHPAVVEAAVVGADHATKGTAPVAFVVRRDDVSERDLRTFTLDHVPTYAHPRRIFFVDELPKSATQKIQRYALEDELDDLLDGPLEPSERL